MQRWNLWMTIGVVFLLVAGGVAAQSGPEADITKERGARSWLSTAADEKPQGQTFKITVEPDMQRGAPGATLGYAVLVHTRADAAFELSVVETAAGLRAHFPEPQLRIAAGETARAKLVVHIMDGAEGRGEVVVQATSRETGESHKARAIAVAVHEKFDRPVSGAGGWRMAMSSDDVRVGPDGARVALLLQNDGTPRALTLAARHDAPGWRLALESEHVRLDAHERTWVWVKLATTHDSDVSAMKYAIVASDGQMRRSVEATASSA